MTKSSATIGDEYEHIILQKGVHKKHAVNLLFCEHTCKIGCFVYRSLFLFSENKLVYIVLEGMGVGDMQNLHRFSQVRQLRVGQSNRHVYPKDANRNPMSHPDIEGQIISQAEYMTRATRSQFNKSLLSKAEMSLTSIFPRANCGVRTTGVDLHRR